MSDAITVDEWAERLNRRHGSELRKALLRMLTEEGIGAKRRAQDNASVEPEARTGTLRRSITDSVTATESELRLALSAGSGTGGKDVPYARTQEDGATIRPRNAKWLTIPMPAAKTAAGVARGPARSFGDLRFVPSATSPGTKAWLVRDVGRGKTARSELMFMLVRKVTIRPKRYLAKAWEPVESRVSARIGPILREVLP